MLILKLAEVKTVCRKNLKIDTNSIFKVTKRNTKSTQIIMNTFIMLGRILSRFELSTDPGRALNRSLASTEIDEGKGEVKLIR